VTTAQRRNHDNRNQCSQWFSRIVSNVLIFLQPQAKPSACTTQGGVIMAYINKEQRAYYANPLQKLCSVSFEGKKPIAKIDPEEGEYIPVRVLIMAQNENLSAKADGPEHGKVPQKRWTTVLVHKDTKEPLMHCFNETKTVTDDDQVIRTYRAVKGGGGQLATIDLEKVPNLQEAIDGAFD
jgi:hypothetical protein